LISEKSPEVRKEVIQQIVKSAEEKVIDGRRPRVTGCEGISALLINPNFIISRIDFKGPYFERMDKSLEEITFWPKFRC